MPDLFSQPSLDPETPWTPSQLARAARRSVEGNIGPLWIRGELSQLKAYQSGHWYFCIGDAEAQVKCVMWKTYSSRVREKPQDGTQVFVFGTPTIWEERGEFRLNCVQLLATPDQGAAQAELDRIRAALEKDGLTDPARKRPLPALPSRIAVVTSSTAPRSATSSPSPASASPPSSSWSSAPASRAPRPRPRWCGRSGW